MRKGLFSEMRAPGTVPLPVCGMVMLWMAGTGDGAPFAAKAFR